MAFERVIGAQAAIIACQDGSSIVGRVALRVVPYRTVQVTAVKAEGDCVLVAQVYSTCPLFYIVIPFFFCTIIVVINYFQILLSTCTKRKSSVWK